MIEIPSCDDPRVHLTIPVPVKGRKTPMILRLPRFDFIEEPVLDEIDAMLEAITKDDDPNLSPRKRNRLTILAMLKLVISAKDYAACETLTNGQLGAINDEWTTQSAIPLGEFMASAISSTESTGAPSNTTSSSADTTDATSDAA